MSSSPRFINYFACLVLLVFSVSNLSGQSARERSGFDIAPDEKAMEAKRALLDKIAPIGTGDERPPNIVLILADDLGYEDTAVYGSKSIPTPHIDALARNGVRFTDAYVTAATCSPSRAGLMSGRYQQRFGFEFNTSSAKITHEKSRGLRPSVITMAEVLQKAGYATGMFGKWHLGTREYFHPHQRGFDEFYGFLAGAHSFFPAEKPQPAYQSIMRGNKRIIEKEYLTDAIAREAVAFIENKKDQPFLAYVPFNAVHTPIEASEKYQKRFPNEKNPTQRDFNAMVSALDDAVGRIVGTLEKYDLKENTLVLFMDDNGGPMYTKVQSNGPLRMGKLFLFEGGVRVPMILSWPGMLERGKVFRGITSSLDVFPTVCAAAGIAIPDTIELDGVDLGPYLNGESKGSPHRSLAWSNGPNKAFREGKWKVIKSGDHTWLFDLSKDIGEQTNVAAENPETVQRLERALNKWLGEMAPPAWPSKPTRKVVDIDGIPYELNI
ncbi:MAG: sulfatase [Opitutaceae bacterium]|nr:sulfatase [Opitutaceae bacterium]